MQSCCFAYLRPGSVAELFMSLTYLYSSRPNFGTTGKPMSHFLVTVEPRYNEVPRDWQNVFAITRFRYIEVLFHIFYYNLSKENRWLY